MLCLVNLVFAIFRIKLIWKIELIEKFLENHALFWNYGIHFKIIIITSETNL